MTQPTAFAVRGSWRNLSGNPSPLNWNPRKDRIVCRCPCGCKQSLQLELCDCSNVPCGKFHRVVHRDGTLELVELVFVPCHWIGIVKDSQMWVTRNLRRYGLYARDAVLFNLPIALLQER